MRKNICKCGHSESDHANHYEYHQCHILGCECLNFEAAQQYVQLTLYDCNGVKWYEVKMKNSAICKK